MKRYLHVYLQLYYRDVENGQWYRWDLRQSTLQYAESEARRLIESKKAVEVEAVEWLSGRGWEYEHQTVVLSAQLCDGQIKVTTGRLMSDEELGKIATPRYDEVEKRLELERSRGWELGR